MFSERKIELGIKKLTRWASKLGYKIYFGFLYDDEINFIEKTITICTRYKKESQLYALVHECGHVVINKKLDSFKKRYIEHSKIYQIDAIAEEIDAWRRGQELATRLKITINGDNYNKEMAKWVYTYVEEACERFKKQ